MKIILTLILSLTTGFEASPEESAVKGCFGGWVEFTCKYPERNQNYQRITVTTGQKQHNSTQNDVWENKDRFYLFHDTKEQKLRVAIKQFHKMDATKYKCNFEPSRTPHTVNGELEGEEEGCQKPLNQTAYRTAKTTIKCKNPGDEFKASVKFFCKETKSVCEDILPTKKNGTFTLINTRDDFNLIISNLTTQHAGDYWCGVESPGHHHVTIRQINLQVKDIRNFTRLVTAGQSYTYWCEYKTASNEFKFICKGDDTSICQPLTTTMNKINTTKFYMKDDLVKNITINVRDVTTDDTGTYWCGSESTNPSRTRTFYHMFLMKVELPHTSTPSVKSSSSSSYPPAATSPVSPVTVSDDSHNGSWVYIIVAICAVVLLLLLLLILVLTYKRVMSSKNRANGAAVNRDKEDCYIYEEIEERPQKQESGTAMNSIYVTANFPTNPSASLHYSTISFPNSPNQADDGAQKTSPSACDYSTVSYTANNPSRSAEEPLYHTANKPQQL